MHFWQNTISLESSKEQHLFEIEIFCNIKNVFTVDQFNVYLMNKSLMKPFRNKTFEQ